MERLKIIALIINGELGRYPSVESLGNILALSGRISGWSHLGLSIEHYQFTTIIIQYLKLTHIVYLMGCSLSLF